MLEFSEAVAPMLPNLLLRLGAALLCGILIGIEREIKDKPAGLRTMMLITAGSALYMIVSELIPIVADGPEDITRVDPGRIAAQVVTGVGFIGAGTIIRERGSVHGLTTAAVIWVAAAVGLCAGVGFPLLALIATGGVLITLTSMDPLGHWMSRRADPTPLTLIMPNDEMVLRRVQFILSQHEIEPEDLSWQVIGDHIELKIKLYSSGGAAARILAAVSGAGDVRGASLSDSSRN